MFEMMLLTVIVRPANYQDVPSTLARADLTYQLNEIEVRFDFTPLTSSGNNITKPTPFSL